MQALLWLSTWLPVQQADETLLPMLEPVSYNCTCFRLKIKSWGKSRSKWGGGMVLSGPCSPNKIFVDIDGVSGMCRCRDPNHLLHRNDDNCYHMYAKVIKNV